MKDDAFEPVLTVHDWWDGPRAGVAHFRGTPHLYLSSWDEAQDDWSDVYTLTAVDQEMLTLLLEDYEIWRRWRLAFDAGTVAKESGPALPQDSSRSSELKRILEPIYNGDTTPVARARPKFRRRAYADSARDPYNVEVRWEVLE
jgi:hypothetical protein